MNEWNMLHDVDCQGASLDEKPSEGGPERSQFAEEEIRCSVCKIPVNSETNCPGSLPIQSPQNCIIYCGISIARFFPQSFFTVSGILFDCELYILGLCR